MELFVCGRSAIRIIYHQFLNLDRLSAGGAEHSTGYSIVLTLALAHSSRPPMGAKMIPMAKSIGRTVLGVRIGLRLDVSWDILFFCRRGSGILPGF